MAKHNLKILRCEHRKIFKVCLAFYNIMHERVKAGAHLGFSEGKGPNFRKGANQYKTKKKQI